MHRHHDQAAQSALLALQDQSHPRGSCKEQSKHNRHAGRGLSDAVGDGDFLGAQPGDFLQLYDHRGTRGPARFSDGKSIIEVGGRRGFSRVAGEKAHAVGNPHREFSRAKRAAELRCGCQDCLLHNLSLESSVRIGMKIQADGLPIQEHGAEIGGDQQRGSRLPLLYFGQRGFPVHQMDIQRGVSPQAY